MTSSWFFIPQLFTGILKTWFSEPTTRRGTTLNKRTPVQQLEHKLLNHKSTAVLSQERKNKHYLPTKTSSVFSHSLGTHARYTTDTTDTTSVIFWEYSSFVVALCVFSESSCVRRTLIMTGWYTVTAGRK